MNERETKELLELTRENNKLLHKMRRHAIYSNIMRLFYWAIILGGPIVIYYYYLQPYLKELVGTYDGVQDGVSNQVQVFVDILKKFGIGR